MARYPEEKLLPCSAFEKPETHLADYDSELNHWLDYCPKLIRELNTLKDEINKISFITNIVNTTGTSVSSVGVILTVAGLTNPMLGLAGLAVNFAGGITSAGASTTKEITVETLRRKLDDLLDIDQKGYRNLSYFFDMADNILEEIWPSMKTKYPYRTIDQMKAPLVVGKNAASVTYNFVKFTRKEFPAIIARTPLVASKLSLAISAPLNAFGLICCVKELADGWSGPTRDLQDVIERLEKAYKTVKSWPMSPDFIRHNMKLTEELLCLPYIHLFGLLYALC